MRPEHLPAAKPGDTGSTLAGDVDLIEALGSELVVHFTIDAHRVIAEGAVDKDEAEAARRRGRRPHRRQGPGQARRQADLRRGYRGNAVLRPQDGTGHPGLRQIRGRRPWTPADLKMAISHAEPSPSGTTPRRLGRRHGQRPDPRAHRAAPAERSVSPARSRRRGAPPARRTLAPLRRRGLLRDPVVTAFLERPLELGVRGAERLVPFPVYLHGTGKRPGESLPGLLRRALKGARQCTGWRRPRRLASGAASPSSRWRLWPFALAAVCARASARVVKLGITRSIAVSAKTRRTAVSG